MTYYRWLMHNRYRSDPIGDLARDAALDGAFPRSPSMRAESTGPETVRAYLEGLGAAAPVLRAQRRAWDEYELYEGGASKLHKKVWVLRD